MSRTRDYRRHQRSKHKARARKFLRLSWFDDDRSWVTPRIIGLVATTAKTCSCYMCGNPRKWWLERTRQEFRSELDEEEFAQMIQLVEVPDSKSG